MARFLYASLLVGYTIFVTITPHGPSEKGLIPIIEYAPLLVLLFQTLWPTKYVWWLMVVLVGLYAGLLILELVRTAWITNAPYRLLAFACVFIALYYDRARERKKGDCARRRRPVARRFGFKWKHASYFNYR
jgi:hypothetical protein